MEEFMKEDLQKLENQSLAPKVNTDNKLGNQNKLKIILLILAGVAILSGTFYAGMKFSTKREDSKVAVPKTVEQLTPTPTTSTLTNNDETSRPVTPLKPNVTAPATFGFIKTIDLPGIGVRASFPENTKISYFDPKTSYSANLPDSWLNFSIYDYQGGSRRSWFRDNIGRPESTFEAFGANNHQGYLSISKDSSGNIYDLYYFAVVGTNKMLVVQYGTGVDSQKLDKFKSFISTLQIIGPNLQGIERQDQAKFETQRWSDIRKMVWERLDLGLRVTTPEWIESRIPKSKKDDGTWEYSEWSRIYPEAKTSRFAYGGEETDGVVITGLFFGGTHLAFLNSKYTGKNFNEVINSLLPGAGFCSIEWKNSKSECGDIYPDYCYTKDEVIQSLVLKRTGKFGPYSGQLRGINASFSQRRDCRGEDIWLIQAQGGQFVLSTIYPDSETIRLEGF